MLLKRLELSGFKSFAHPTVLEFSTPVTAVVGPNGSGKSNIAEAMRFVLGEQSMKSLRGKRGEDLIFHGSKSLHRQNRASVAVVFDNKDGVFPLDYDEIEIKRAVYRDGDNHYFINGSRTRLKDIFELLEAYLFYERAGIGNDPHQAIHFEPHQRFPDRCAADLECFHYLLLADYSPRLLFQQDYLLLQFFVYVVITHDI